MDAARARAQLERLRGYRVWERDTALAGELIKQTKALSKLHRSLGGIGEQWGSLLPRDLAARTQLRGLARGVLTVAVPDAATDYELDRWLRSGGLASLRRAGANVSRVKSVYAHRTAK